MRIEAESLTRFLAYDLHGEEGQNGEICWKEILRYPREGWTPKINDEDIVEFAILDPGVVLGRMFCVMMDKELRAPLMENGIEAPLSWLLRIEDDWQPGEVLQFVKGLAPSLVDPVTEIELYFPQIFEDEGNNDLMASLQRAQERFNKCKLIHISAPRFHHNWTDLVGVKEHSEEARIAKQQWSMSVSVEIENYGLDIPGDCWVLQAGGGHVLIAAQTTKKGLNDAIEGMLENLQNRWLEKRNWAPRLWASWDGGAIQHELMQEDGIEAERIIEDLWDEFQDYSVQRKNVRARWAIFGFGRGTVAADNIDDRATLYLDVINLGDHCWPKEGVIFVDDIPTRSSDDTIKGFTKSRILTAVIESTFGLILAQHTPNEIHSMGGDEMIADIGRSEWIDIVDAVEAHCSILFSTIIDEDPRLLWWAMIQEGQYLDPANQITDLKNVVREMTAPHCVRFVNPMWSSMIEGDEEDRNNAVRPEPDEEG